MTDFVFDKSLRDSSHGVHVSITVVDADKDSDVQINIRSGCLRHTFFLSFYHARQVAAYLLQACDAYDQAVAAPKSVETDEG